MTRHNQPISDSRVSELLAIPGVVSVGEGLEQGQRAVIVGVENQETAKDPRIPGEIEGFPVVVEVEGPIGPASAAPPLAETGQQSLPTPVSADTVMRYRPIPPGVSIGHKDITAGTASFLAKDQSGKVYQLSNSHVLAKYGNADVGDEIYQPGSHDNGGPEDTVGSLAGYAPINDSNNTLDLAWYSPEDTQLAREIALLNEEPLPSIEDPEIGDEITFVGRSSGKTTATVDRINTSIEVRVGDGEVTFTDQFRIDKPLIPGDSGSPILIETDEGFVPVGIGFAATKNVGYCNYLRNVERDTELTVLPASETDEQEDGGADFPPKTRSEIPEKVALLIGAGIGASVVYDIFSN